MPQHTHKQSALQYTVYLLSRRDHSERELRQKLTQKAYLDDEIEYAINKVQENQWQNDERFCTLFIRSRAAQYYGPARIKQELRQKGISDWLVSQSLENSEIDWFEKAECLFNKKCPTEWNIKTKQKMWRYMLSRGFQAEHFRHLMELDFTDNDEMTEHYFDE